MLMGKACSLGIWKKGELTICLLCFGAVYQACTLMCHCRSTEHGAAGGGVNLTYKLEAFPEERGDTGITMGEVLPWEA